MGERIDSTIDSGCAACVLPVGVASAVGMQESNRTPQEYIAANADKIRELRFKIPTLKFQNGDVQNLKFSVMYKLHNPLVAACKVVAAGTRALMTDLDFMGDKRVIFKSDQVPSIVALCDAVKNGGHGEIVLEASPKSES